MMIDINLDEYNYLLPQEKIALFPLENRAESKLLLVDKKSQKISHHIFKEIPDLLSDNAVVFLNKTKVIAARLLLQKATGGLVEVLCVEPLEPSTDPQIAMSVKEKCKWKCFIGGKRVQLGSVLYSIGDLKISATVIEKHGQDAIVEFRWQMKNQTFAELLDSLGKVPLPPYIKREVAVEDKERYQTVYAEDDGSVAAPTAGLHFTEEILLKLRNKGIRVEELILHVGPGTFKPIDTDKISEHKMHSELIIVSKSLIENLLKSIVKNRYIIATGTTSLRTLETLYWVGVKLKSSSFEFRNGEFEFGQWDAYNLWNNISAEDSIKAILNYLNESNHNELRGRTELLIIPGYEFRIVKGLITNYHLPKSTLILLVAAFLGKDLWRKAYVEALNYNYRFLSYGDSSLLLS